MLPRPSGSVTEAVITVETVVVPFLGRRVSMFTVEGASAADRRDGGRPAESMLPSPVSSQPVAERRRRRAAAREETTAADMDGQGTPAGRIMDARGSRL
jgi:hypothetical protein